MTLRRSATAVLCLAAVAACSPPTKGKYASQPPKEYQKDVTVAVAFMEPTKAALLCRSSAHEAGVTPEFCTLPGPVIVWPNPCPWPNDSDQRQGGCHEIGHVNGWPPNHPGAIK